MKRLFTFLALVLGLVSCQTEPEGFDANAGGEQDVNITVSLPESTRSNSAEGAFANVDLGDENDTKTIRYILKIYQKVGGDYVASTNRQVEYSDGTSVVFPVRLVPNRDYRFVVWADYVERKDDTDLHYNTTDLANITLNDTWVAMDETRDAFTGYFDTAVEGEKYTSASSINIKLTRPFAKLRVITTDMVELGYLNIVPHNAVVTYMTQFHESFNAFNGQYGVETVGKTHTYTIADYADQTGANKVLFTDYFFADDSDVVKFVMNVNEANGVLIKSNTFNTDIAVKRNYLTTIQGNILTDGNNVSVTVEDAFENANNTTDEPYYQVAVTNAYEYLVAYYEGREMIALNDIVVTPADVDAYWATRSAAAIHPVLNLNGYTVTFVNDTDEPLLTVAEGSSFTVNGGSIVVVGDGVGIENNGTLNITGSEIEAEDGTAIVNNAIANIEDTNLNKGAVENNGTTNVNGGEVADDAIENTDNAVVGTYVYNADELQAAINAAVKTDAVNEISFGANIAGTVTLVQNPGVKVVINGCDYKYEGSIKIHSNSNFYAGAAVTIKNVNFEASEADVNFIEALENGSQRYSTNITVEDCTFVATDAAVGTSVALQIKASKNAKILNSTAQGLHSLVQAQSCDETVVVKDCVVEGKNGVAFKQVKAATVENTTIVAQEYGIRFDGNTDNYGIVVKNNNVTAYQPLIVRKMTGKNNTIALEGENTLTTEEAYKIVITNGSDDAAYVTPTGTYTLTGADNFVVYPRDVVSSWAEFTAALAANKASFLLAEDITYDANYQLQKDVVIDLNGKSMTLPMINIHNKVIIKNGTINGKVYARKNSNITFENVKFSGAISDNLSTEGHLAIQSGCTLYAKDCLFSPTSVSGSQTKPLSFEGGSSNMKFEGCEFKSSPYKKQVYFNSLSATGSLNFTNCNFNNKTPNIMFAAACPLTNLTMSGTTKLSSVTLETNRAKDAVTAEDLAYLRESLIANNSMSSVRLFYAGGSSEYIR